MNKLLILGIDAATWDVIDDGIEQGKMPFVERLKDEGVFGTLASTNPPRTCPAWPCFMTGKKPGKLGFYGFRSLESDYSRKVRSFADLPATPYWDYLAEDGHTNGVLNVPVTWPPHITDFHDIILEKVGSDGHVIAVEPDTENRERLEENIALNDLENVTVIPKAVWSEDGTVTFSADGTMESQVDAAGTEVECISLESLAEEYGVPDFVKMDIEGAEIESLEGGATLLDNGVNMAIKSYHKRGGKETSEFLEKYAGKKSLPVRTVNQFPREKTTYMGVTINE